MTTPRKMTIAHVSHIPKSSLIAMISSKFSVVSICLKSPGSEGSGYHKGRQINVLKKVLDKAERGDLAKGEHLSHNIYSG
jgi:hypothetical protein